MVQPKKKKDGATEYAKLVASGVIVAGPHVRDACARHLHDLEHAHERGLVWDVEAVHRFSRFCEKKLRLSEGQFDGIPFKLEPSQEFIAGSIFGWKWKSSGKRRFTRAYIEQGKGNGKSPLVGAIGLYGLMADGEAGAQVYSAGATKEQAGILFQDACKMVRQSPDLEKRIKFSGSEGKEWNMAFLASGSFFRPVSRDTKKSGSGPRPHFALCDEVHEHPDGGVIEILERGFKFREQPLLVMITNSGSDRQSICWKEREHAVQVAAQEREDDSTFAYVCALDEGDDPFTDESCWIKANPLLGVTITTEYLRKNVRQAANIPAKANGIKRLHFCIWTDSEEAWISRAAWEAIEDETLDMKDFIGRRAFGGLDLSARSDLTAKAILFEDGVTEEKLDPETGDVLVPAGLQKYAAFVHGYTPADTLAAREETDGAPYSEWVEKGWITATPGKKIRLDYVAKDIYDEHDEIGFDVIGYDQFLIDSLVDELDILGANIPLVDHPQGWTKRTTKTEAEGEDDITLWMPGSVDMLETLILEGRLRVHVNHALRSAVASATFDRSPADLRRFTKQKATARIDMAVALAMGVGAATEGVPVRAFSPWDEEGFIYESD